MQCNNCGAELRENARFCMNCGTRVEAEASEAAAAPEVAGPAETKEAQPAEAVGEPEMAETPGKAIEAAKPEERPEAAPRPRLPRDFSGGATEDTVGAISDAVSASFEKEAETAGKERNAGNRDFGVTPPAAGTMQAGQSAGRPVYGQAQPAGADVSPTSVETQPPQAQPPAPPQPPAQAQAPVQPAASAGQSVPGIYWPSGQAESSPQAAPVFFGKWEDTPPELRSPELSRLAESYPLKKQRGAAGKVVTCVLIFLFSAILTAAALFAAGAAVVYSSLYDIMSAGYYPYYDYYDDFFEDFYEGEYSGYFEDWEDFFDFDMGSADFEDFFEYDFNSDFAGSRAVYTSALLTAAECRPAKG